MKEPFLNKLKYYQLFGVVIGVFMTIYMVYNFYKIQSLEILTLSFSIIFFGLNFYSFFLLKNKNIKKAIILIQLLLIVQLFSIHISEYFYSAVNGIALYLTLNLKDDLLIGLEFRLSNFLLTSSESANNCLIKLNLIPFFILMYLSKFKIVNHKA